MTTPKTMKMFTFHILGKPHFYTFFIICLLTLRLVGGKIFRLAADLLREASQFHYSTFILILQ